jgi:hypothetical protein
MTRVEENPYTNGEPIVVPTEEQAAELARDGTAHFKFRFTGPADYHIMLNGLPTARYARANHLEDDSFTIALSNTRMREKRLLEIDEETVGIRVSTHYRQCALTSGKNMPPYTVALLPILK